MFQNYKQELSNLPFDVKEVAHFLYGGAQHFEEYQAKLAVHSEVDWDPNLFNLARKDWIKQSIKQTPKLVNPLNIGDPETVSVLHLAQQFQVPGSIHLNMFVVVIKLMGTQSQQKQFLEKCATYEIVGCYAQTEIGHGSDVQSLQTTATLDIQKDEFIVNTPTIQAAKWWPGDMGIYANWALVHARLVIKNKDYGIQNFLVPIRDQNHKLLPGVEAGDIGPKFGFLAKDNGYLLLNNVRIPRRNMLRKYVKIQDGVFSKRGNERQGYATMMMVRRLISCHATKAYMQALVIAGKYSFARKQFKNDKKEEIAIINYQLQQNKILSCMAEHFAIQISALKISAMTQLNIDYVNRNDDSLMQQTHNCLCLSKALYTEYYLRGIETLRLACGGHGFSQYSGLPHLLQQASPNVTLEGQNTVMFLQVARYIMKAYKNSVSKKKPLGESVNYINSFDELMSEKVSVQTPDAWDVKSIKLMLSQNVLHLVTCAAEKLMTDQNQKAAWNFKAGIRLHQLAHSHAVYWTFNSFSEAVSKFQGGDSSRQVLTELCILYGINSVLSKLQSLIEGGLVTRGQITTLQERKQKNLKYLRTNLTGLIQSLNLPAQYERSALTRGDVYKNMFQLAKRSQTNQSMSPAVGTIKKMTNCRPKL